MKILLDARVWGGARKELESAGHDTVWAGDWPEDPGDDAILARACSEGRVLHGIELQAGALLTVEPGRLRIRLPGEGSES